MRARNLAGVASYLVLRDGVGNLRSRQQHKPQDPVKESLPVIVRAQGKDACRITPFAAGEQLLSPSVPFQTFCTGMFAGVLLVLNNLDSAGLIVNVYGVNGSAHATIWSGSLFVVADQPSEPLRLQFRRRL